MTSSFRSERGLALLQILFVLIVLAIGASVVMMNVTQKELAEGPTLTWQRMDALKDAIVRYRSDTGGNPPTLDALTTLTGAPCASDPVQRKLTGWCGPYLTKDPAGSDLHKRDGWKTLLQYNGTTLVSCGPNKTCG